MTDEKDKRVFSRVPDEVFMQSLCAYLDPSLQYRVQMSTGVEVYAPASAFETVVVPPYKIGGRLGAGGLRDLANQASQMPGGAGGKSPKERAEFRQPKRKP